MQKRSGHQNNGSQVLLEGGIGRRRFVAAALGAATITLANGGCGVASETSSTAANKYDAELAKLIKSYSVPGMAAARVTTEGVTIRARAGVRKYKSPEPIGPDDRFHLGSNTKSMTSALAAMFVQEKKLDFETTIADVFKPKGYEIDERFGKATLKQLLSHRSGVAESSTTSPEWMKLWEHAGPPEKSREEYVRVFLNRAPSHQVGSHYEYSNEGYMIAGHMLEVIAGKPWEALMQEYLFDPLEMKTAGFGAPGSKDKIDEPWGHEGWWKPVAPGKGADNPAGLGPAGTVHASIDDWGKFIAFILRAAQDKEERLSKENFAVLSTPPDKHDDYGLGWIVTERDWAGGKAIWHNGSNTMWYALAWLAPDKGFAAIAACNQMGSWPTSACDAAIGVMIEAKE